MSRAQILIESDSPLIASTVSEFDQKTGINILHTWEYHQDPIKLELLEYNKVVMAGVLRHDDTYYEKFPTFFFCFGEHNLGILGSFFLIKTQSYKSYYSIAFFVDMSNFNSEIPLVNVTEPFLTTAAASIRNCLLQKSQIILATSVISGISNSISSIMSSGIATPKYTNPPPPQLAEFLAYILSSHLQTHMTTVIEADNKEEAQYIFDFLSAFLLPNQKLLSSGTLRESPTPGLFLQMVEKQPSLPSSILWQFQRPYTWVRVAERKVVQSPDLGAQRQAYNMYMQGIALRPGIRDDEAAQIMQEIKRSYKLSYTQASQAVRSLITSIAGQSREIATFRCREFFSDVIRKSVLLLAMAEELSEGRAKIIQNDVVPTIAQKIGVKDREEMKCLVTAASLFDRSAPQRILSAKREVIMQLVAAV